MAILTFDEAIERSSEHRHLLLGNGFSIALKPAIFTYGALLDRAELHLIEGGAEAFHVLQTNDFETVIRACVDAERLVQIYDSTSSIRRSLSQLANGLRDRLVSAIAGSHPALPNEVTSEQYQKCRAFLNKFKRRYTLNYDLLIYWALMHSDVDELGIECDDGFRDSPWEEDADYVSWVEHHSATVMYLHGAVHLFDAGHELIKYTWTRTSVPLMEQIKIALNNERYPLFVAEGSSKDKFAKIAHSVYLHRTFRSFSTIEGDLFIFGHSLKSNDQHILNAISEGKIGAMYVSVFGDPDSANNREVMANAEAIAAMRKSRRSLNVHFYDAASAHVWD